MVILFLGGQDYRLFTLSEYLHSRFGFETLLASSCAPERRGGKRRRFLRLDSQGGWWKRAISAVRIWRFIGSARWIVVSPEIKTALSSGEGVIWGGDIWERLLIRRLKRSDARLHTVKKGIVDIDDWPFLLPPDFMPGNRIGVLLLGSNDKRIKEVGDVLERWNSRHGSPFFFESVSPAERMKMRKKLETCAIVCDLDATDCPSEAALQAMASGRCAITAAPTAYYESLPEEPYLVGDMQDGSRNEDGMPLYGPVIDRPEDPEDIFEILVKLSESGALPDLMFDSYRFVTDHHNVSIEADRLLSRLEIGS